MLSYKIENFNNISEFYPFYLSQHINNLNRLLHLTGTTLATCLLITLLWFKMFAYVYFCLIVGYGFAWLGHFFFEKNKPATFKYPLYSLLCDYIMAFDIITGNILLRFKKYSIENVKYIDTDLF